MKHTPIPKHIRQLVYDKYNGHCAYCGCELPYKDMQVDHLHSLNGNKFGYDKTADPNDISNLMPACRQCNYYKGASSLETFRKNLATTLQHTCTDSFQTRLAIKYGMIIPKQWDKLFYFEKTENNENINS